MNSVLTLTASQNRGRHCCKGNVRPSGSYLGGLGQHASHVKSRSQVAPEGDAFVALADKALASLAQSGIFGTYLVDYIPLRMFSLADPCHCRSHVFDT